MRKGLLLGLVLAVMGSSVSAAPVERDQEKKTACVVEEKKTSTVCGGQPHAVDDGTYDAETDYMAAVIEAIIAGDYEAAGAAMQARDEKIRGEGLEAAHVDVDELWLLSKIIYAEAGSNWLSDEHQRMVGSVVLNRMASPEFPDTMREVLEQPGQYYGAGSSYFDSLVPSERAVRNALYLLENGSIAPAGVVFQANFVQGSGVYMEIEDEHLGSSYFCWSSRPELYE